MDLFDIVVARKLSGGGGGGGSSDFSTAEVTIDNEAGAMFLLPNVDEDGLAVPSLDRTHGTGDAILYKGTALGVVLGDGVTVTTTGAVVYNEPTLLITGDCTITIS